MNDIKYYTSLSVILIFISCQLQAQWNDNGDNSTTGSLAIGSDLDDSYSKFTIRGPNMPFGIESKRDIIFDFKNAGQAQIRSYRGGSWDTHLQFLTSESANTGGNPTVRMHINGEGNVGIGTTNPKQKLHVKGALYIEGTESYSGGWNINRLQWGGHSLIMGTRPGQYAHNKVELKPGGSATGPLHSSLEIYASPSENEHELKVKLHSMGTSYFNGGNVGIGTTLSSNPNGYKLAVNGKIGAKEVQVENTSTTWPDYVFSDNYILMPLKQLETYLKENRHLPGIPTAEKIEEEGIKLGAMNAKLLEKIEELTLYVIEQNKKIEALEERNESQDQLIMELLKQKQGSK